MEQLQSLKQKIVEQLLARDIVKFSFTRPLTFKSGIKSPIYCNFRECSEDQELMNLLKLAFVELLSQKNITKGQKDTVIVGVATGGVPHAMLLANELMLPFAYVRPGAKAKGYGLGNAVEGAHIAGKDVILIEDLTSTGGSALEVIELLVKAGVKSVIPYSIFTYGTGESEKNFAKAGYTLHSILTGSELIPFLENKLSEKERTSLHEWLRDPRAWFEKEKYSLDLGYLSKLRTSARDNKSIVCMGIDIVPEHLPEEFKKDGIRGGISFCKTLFEEMIRQNILPGAFKPNHAFYAIHNNPFKNEFDGYVTLGEILKLVKEKFPGTPIIFDYKRGDIGKTSANYAREGLETWDFDSVTVSPYMGEDSVSPFAEYCTPEKKKGIYVLARTSNPGGKDFQNLYVNGGQPLYDAVAEKIIEWSRGKTGVGAVVGAPSMDELTLLAKHFSGKDIPLLIPGIGTQGGNAKDVLETLRKASYDLELVRINSSSGLLQPWGTDSAPANWKDVCIENLRILNAETNIY